MINSIDSYSSISTRKGVSGVVSGLDTDEIVKGMTSGTRSKIASLLQSKEILTWKRDSYRSISSKLIAFSEKYMSFSSTSNILSNSFFQNSTISAIGENSSCVSVTGDPKSVQGLSIESIDQLATYENFISNKNASSHALLTNDIDLSAAGRTVNNLAGETINLSYEGKIYNVTIDKDFTGTTASEISDAFNAALSKIELSDGSTLDSKIEMKDGGDGSTIEIISKDGNEVSVSAGSKSALTALGISTGASSTSSSDPITGTLGDITSQIVFNDLIKGKSMIFDYNGIQKTITFSDTKTYSNIGELKAELQSQLDTAFGAGKITVAGSGEDGEVGSLSFTTTNDSSILTFVNADKELAGLKGIFNTETYTSNRLNLYKPISDMATELGLTPNGDGNYVMNVNGKEFTFDGSKSIKNVIDTINSSNAGVSIKYLSVTDKFSVSATDSGSLGNVNISDTSGNLASILIGTAGTDYNINEGKDAVMKISYDGGVTESELIRNSNTFSIDGANITLNSTFSEGDAVTFTSKQNADDMVKVIKDMVNDYNEIIELVNTEVSTKRNRDYKPLTNEQEEGMTDSQIEEWNKKAKAGMLFADSDLRTLTSELRFAFSFAVPNSGSISDIGLSTSSNYQDNGKILVDEEKLKKALEERPDEVKNMFTMPKSTESTATQYDAGIMTRVKGIFDKYSAKMGEKGIFIKKAGLENSYLTLDSDIYKSMKEIDEQVERLSTSLKAEEDRYYTQFTALEKYISQMNTQSSWLTDQFSS
ncbi:flagellar filament capping protein FliD [Anaerovorax odorimutans]|uniref:flagellar filament capping protein FliD n=1 Tax=Anaerovorax odorimutans TaxID=109327 RepID=UPI0003FC587A|nr:flagellar filament capping protein FliD [Anaerovorax odorimutans]